jgi:NADH-quinone oxidoreductase subunit H
VWFAFDHYLFMLLPFAIYMIAAVAETNRAPFDLPEAESELVGGFHTEYSGFRWALYFLAEYANVFVVSCVAVTLFWGGWLRPFPGVAWLEIPLNYVFPAALCVVCGWLSFRLIPKLKYALHRYFLAALAACLILMGLVFVIPPVNPFVVGLFWFLLKVTGVIYLLSWFRGTFPRFRYDQLMRLGWKVFLPFSLFWLVLTAGVLLATGWLPHA